MQHFSQSSIFCVHPSAAAGLRQAFVNDRNGEILLYVTLPCIKETVRFQAGSRGWVLCNGSAAACAAVEKLREWGDDRQGAVTAAPLLERQDVRERRLAKFRQNVARFRLYRLRFLQENMRFAAFFKIYQILKLKFLKFDKILQILRHLQFFC